MDQYVIALILGVIEGITECIPVSITVKAFLWYLNRSSLASFGYYRIIVAILAIIYLYM